MLKRILLSLALMLTSLVFVGVGIPIEFTTHLFLAMKEIVWYLPAHVFRKIRRGLKTLGEGFEMLFYAPFPEDYRRRKEAQIKADKEKLKLHRQVAREHMRKEVIPKLRELLDKLEKE